MRLLLRLPPGLRDSIGSVLKRWQAHEDPEKLETLIHGGSKGTQSSNRSKRWARFTPVPDRRFWGITALMGIILILIASTLHRSHTSAQRPAEPDTQFLHLLIPASQVNPDLCKTVLSASVLMYPTPHLVNWHVDLDQPGKESERDYAKITFIKDYLHNVLPKFDGGTVLMVEPGSWFQLRPEIVLSRYLEINGNANERLRKSFGSDVIEAGRIRQTVLFAAQDRCLTSSADERVCGLVPNSPVEANGAGTRFPRFLSAGSFIGSVKEARATFDEVFARAEHDRNHVDMQRILSEILADQELQRQVILEQHWSWLQKAWHSFQGDRLPASFYEHQSAVPSHDKQREFGIGLDYGSQIGLFAGDTTNDIEFVQAVERSHLPDDIAASTPPFWTLSNHDIPTHKTWADASLLILPASGMRPAIIHPLRDEKLRKTWWERLWFHSYTRRLFDSQVYLPGMPAASVVDSSGQERVFWGTTIDRAGVKLGAGEQWMKWTDMCGAEDMAAELFGDNLGPWKDPRP